MESKWSDPQFHLLECMRELSAAENHLVQYINANNTQDLTPLLEEIRETRKSIEKDVLGE